MTTPSFAAYKAAAAESALIQQGAAALAAGKKAAAANVNGNPNITGNATTATNKQAIPFFQQPKFDPRLTTLPFLSGQGSGQVSTGYMIWDIANPLKDYNNKAIVHFLYNPTTVAVNYSMDAADITSTLTYRASNDTASAAVMMNAGVSFSLLFDRSFELWGGYNTNGTPKTSTPGNYGMMSDASQGGVNVDIVAMKQFTGQLATQNAGAGNGSVINTYNQQGPMMMVPAWVYFGPPSGGLYYYGYVSAWNVTVTHWSQYMAPMRCGIDVTFALLPPPAGVALTGSGANNWWSLKSLSATPVANPAYAANLAQANVLPTASPTGKAGR